MKEVQTLVIGQLSSMLVNHPERPHSKLDVVVNNKDGELLEYAMGLDVFAFDAKDAILEKVNTLKLKGGLVSIDVEQIGQNEKGVYELILSV